MIRIVTFDLDDTLWDLAPVMRRANARLWDWLGRHAPRVAERYSPEELARLRSRIAAARPEIAHSVTAIRRAVLDEALTGAGYAGTEAERLRDEAFAFFLAERNRVELFPQTREMLQQLARHYRLGALSNGNADLALVGLADYFEFSFNADTVGSAKPDPLMFRHMLAHTGARPEEVVHVGDSIEHDVRGAQAIGIHALWVNLNGAVWPGGPRPAIEVRSLSEIPAAIAALDQGLRRRARSDH